MEDTKSVRCSRKSHAPTIGQFYQNYPKSVREDGGRALPAWPPVRAGAAPASIGGRTGTRSTWNPAAARSVGRALVPVMWREGRPPRTHASPAGARSPGAPTRPGLRRCIRRSKAAYMFRSLRVYGEVAVRLCQTGQITLHPRLGHGAEDRPVGPGFEAGDDAFNRRPLLLGRDVVRGPRAARPPSPATRWASAWPSRGRRGRDHWHTRGAGPPSAHQGT